MYNGAANTDHLAGGWKESVFGSQMIVVIAQLGPGVIHIFKDQRRAMKHYNHTWDDFVCVRDNGDLIPLEYVSKAFSKLCEDCGLRKLKLHELRHTNISLLLPEGASMKEVQEWAGHSNYSVTANTYAHIQAKSKSKLTDSIGSLLA